MMTLGFILTAVLGALALLHALWTFEVWWPIRDEPRLVSAVVGFEDVHRMPGAIPCGLVAIGLFGAALFVWLPDGWVRDAYLGATALVLGVRGGLSYVPAWRRLTTQQPFARNDVWVYGPLMIGLSVGLFRLLGWL